ncbi:DUF3857 domain-containing protein [Tenacibaculum sp. 190524A02b]|uniref:DUF3857 domain-containing protein n=1 Tax=Tenacibaculum vairaonense TaxID=3137860 RepID=UPI0031FB7134
MKKLLFVFALITSTFSIAQTKLELELREQFWKTPAKEIVNTTIPEKWSNESAVILKDHRYVMYFNRGKNILSKKNKHQIIKIQDQSSLETFSEIELKKDFKLPWIMGTYSRRETTIGIRVIKPDAKEIIIDIEAVEVKEDNIKKIAIPSLEIGDILDVFIQTDSKKKELDGVNIFPANESTLKDNYPILDYRLAVEVENDFFLNMNTYNGAPALKEEPTDRNATQKYVVEATNIDKLKTKRWYFPLVEQPSVKYQIAFARKRKNEKYVDIFTGEDGEVKSKVTEEDVFDYFDRKFNKSSTKYASDILKYIKEKGLTNKTEVLKAALDYIRFHKFTSYFEPRIAYEAKIIERFFVPRNKCSKNYFGMYDSDITVMSRLRAVCKKYDIDYDVILVQPRYDGKLEDLLIKSNARVGLKFKTEPNLYFFDFNENMTFERFPHALEGSEAYQGAVVKGKRIEKLEKVFLGTSSAEQNHYKENINLKLNEDKKGFMVNRELIARGHFEDQYIKNWIHFTDFLAEDYKKFPEKGHFYECGSKKTKKRFSTQFKAFEDKKREEFIKNREEYVDSEWSEGKVTEFNTSVIETGRYGDKTPLKIKEDFLLKDGYIKKAGKNIIIEIGKFIGGQVKIEDDEKNRKANIYIDFAKTYNYEITLELPEGYSVQGIESLNTSIENETGAFIAKAQVKEGKLIIETTKKYKANFIENAQWSTMVTWLDEAFKFTQAKILLKKG